MKAIVLMNMWASRNKEEFKIFLENMFYDKYILTIKNNFFRKILSKIIANKIFKKSWTHFEEIWWKSPMYDITEKLVSKIQEKYPDDKVFYCMRYTKPFSQDIFMQIKKQNIKNIYLLPLYPHNSTTTNISSIEDFLQQIDNNFVLQKPYCDFSEIEKQIKNYDFSEYKIEVKSPFLENISYNNQILENIEKLKIWDYSEYNLIFSAHGLPESIVKKWDIYKLDIEKHSQILSSLFIKNNMNFKSINLAYQSKVWPQKWLSPSLWDTLQLFKWQKVVVLPLSFVIENSETTYELDIEYRNIAKNIWISDYLRVSCVNELLNL